MGQCSAGAAAGGQHKLASSSHPPPGAIALLLLLLYFPFTKIPMRASMSNYPGLAQHPAAYSRMIPGFRGNGGGAPPTLAMSAV